MLKFEARRCWVLGLRLHHGTVGCGLVAVGFWLPDPYGPLVLAFGVALAVHDWPDRRFWFRAVRR